jgi:hypothetical protein
MYTTRLAFLGTLALAVMVGCETPTGVLNTTTASADGASIAGPASTDSELALLDSELAAARAGTARYQRVENAVADGYVDIGLCVPGQGCHFLNASLIDAEFDPAKPEILMYSPEGDRMRLVGLEYAVPLTEAKPEGFTGEADDWHANGAFGLWLLHVWTWRNNPDGMFEDSNPLVP